MIAQQEITEKTIYLGGHDGQSWGFKPPVQIDMPLIKAKITHTQMSHILQVGYCAMKAALAQELGKMTIGDDNGVWP